MLSCDGSCQSENGKKQNSCLIEPLLFEVHNPEDYHFIFPNIYNSEACRQESVAHSVEDILPNNSHVYRNNFESCLESEKMDYWPYGVDTPSGCVGIESSADLLGHFTDIHLRQDMENNEQAVCSEYSSPLNTQKSTSEGLTSTCRESCSNSTNVVLKGVSCSQIGTEGRSKRLSDEIETETADITSPVGKFENDLDNANSYGKDINATVCS